MRNAERLIRNKQENNMKKYPKTKDIVNNHNEFARFYVHF